MDPRYSKNPEIKRIWTPENKLDLWQRVELAVIDARGQHNEVPKEDARQIRLVLEATPVDLPWWKEKDAEIEHDLIAFVEERRRHLPPSLQHLMHAKMTSFDTEDPAFVIMLRESVAEVERLLEAFILVLINQTERYRYTAMLGETHGQWAELQTFGKRIATWLSAIVVDARNLRKVVPNLKYSKLSGAIGNSPDLSPEIQETALKSLGLRPFYGATQIMPRELYAPIANSLGVIVATLAKIATDIRLSARSGRTLMREPFGKRQKGSSRMPHKKNTITLEQMEGMRRMAEGYVGMIHHNIQTWQERAIEQSCVERVAWPDLFYVTTHALRRMTSVLEGLQVHQDEMLREIYDCRGVYAASKAVDLLCEMGGRLGLTAEHAYRIVQLAAFIAFEPDPRVMEIRSAKFATHAEAEDACVQIRRMAEEKLPQASIYQILKNAQLKPSIELEATKEQIDWWNGILRQIFACENVLERWNEIFSFSYNLRGEKFQINPVLSSARYLLENK